MKLKEGISLQDLSNIYEHLKHRVVPGKLREKMMLIVLDEICRRIEDMWVKE